MNNQLPIKTGTWSLIRYRPWHFALSNGDSLCFGMRLRGSWLEKAFDQRGQATAVVSIQHSGPCCCSSLA
ncbi:MAG: hypothetical protein H6657_01870 [Ardenticatenaceae bacterium]|nr:hypothetical protein [Ardenticatenaceae bacterium]